jgi:hypothetical protein
MFEKNVQAMKNKALYIKALGEIYTHLEDEMNWNCMKYHDPDDYHAKAWFTALDDEDCTDYIKAQYKAYKKVLYQIEALVADV